MTKKKLNYRNSKNISKKNIQTGGGLWENTLLKHIRDEITVLGIELTEEDKKNIIGEELTGLEENYKTLKTNLDNILSKNFELEYLPKDSSLGKGTMNSRVKLTLECSNEKIKAGKITIKKVGKGFNLSTSNKAVDMIKKYPEDYLSFINIYNDFLINDFLITDLKENTLNKIRDVLKNRVAKFIKEIVNDFFTPKLPKLTEKEQMEIYTIPMEENPMRQKKPSTTERPASIKLQTQE